jgi:hypothetical protein
VNIRRLLLASFCVGAVIAGVATVSVDILLPWDQSVSVIDAPNDQLDRLTATELNDKINSGAIPLKSVRGLEKAFYVLTRDPMWLVSTWTHFFVASVLAAFLGGLFVGGRSIWL